MTLSEEIFRHASAFEKGLLTEDAYVHELRTMVEMHIKSVQQRYTFIGMLNDTVVATDTDTKRSQVMEYLACSDYQNCNAEECAQAVADMNTLDVCGQVSRVTRDDNGDVITTIVYENNA